MGVNSSFKIFFSADRIFEKSENLGFSKNLRKSRIFEKSKILIFLRIFDFSQGFSKNFDFSKIRDFQIFRKFDQPKKNPIIKKCFFCKITKLHRNTFQEHPTTPFYGARNTSDQPPIVFSPSKDKSALMFHESAQIHGSPLILCPGLALVQGSKLILEF